MTVGDADETAMRRPSSSAKTLCGEAGPNPANGKRGASLWKADASSRSARRLSSLRIAKRAIRAVRFVARDGRIPRPLRWLAVIGLLPIPGPVDEAVLLLVSALLWTLYRDTLTGAWRLADGPPTSSRGAGRKVTLGLPCPRPGEVRLRRDDLTAYRAVREVPPSPETRTRHSLSASEAGGSSTGVLSRPSFRMRRFSERARTYAIARPAKRSPSALRTVRTGGECMPFEPESRRCSRLSREAACDERNV